MSAITPFHCWTEYWKAKEIVDQAYTEASTKDSHFLVCETSKLIDRILQWEEKHSIQTNDKSILEIKGEVLNVYPYSIIAKEDLNWAVYHPDNGWNKIGHGFSAGAAWKSAYEHLKLNGIIL